MAIFLFLIYFIFSDTNSLDSSSNQIYSLELNESECIYDKNYSESIYSNSVVCLIRCNFNSIISKSDGGAVVISLRNRFGNEIIISKCTFEKCNSNCGSAIYLNLLKNCSTKVNNSLFSNNKATSNGGAMYIISETKNSFEMLNCSCENNTASEKGGCIYIKNFIFILNTCQFNSNSLYTSGFLEDIEGAAIHSTQSNGRLSNCSFINCSIKGRYDTKGATSFYSTNVLFIKCLFYNNFIQTETDESDGSAAYLSYSKGIFESSIFFNNTAIIERSSSKGGAVSYASSDGSFRDCQFINNTAYSKSYNSFGGAIYFYGNSLSLEIYTCSFINNSAYCKVSDSFGGAIYFYSKNGNFENLTFEHNSAFSGSSDSFGGSMYIRSVYSSFTNIIFMNSLAYSQSKNSNGGAIFINNSLGSFDNCSFISNDAETFLDIYLISGDEPRSLGGAVHINASTINFTNCNFIDNIGFGNAPKHVSTGRGGAIYANYSQINIIKCSFLNNSLFNYGNKYDIESYLYSKQSLNCVNCMFKNNLIYIPNNQEKEFAGAVCLTNGVLDNCTFIDNFAYNGGDIRYDQINNSCLLIQNCNFKSLNFYGHQVKSLIHFRGSYNVSLPNTFEHNKVLMNKTTLLFDGDNKINDDDIRIVKFKFGFNYNCMSPFDDKLFKSNELSIYDKDGENQVTLNSAFESNCDEYVDPTPSQSAKTITPTISISQSTQIPTPTKSFSQTTQIPKPTRSIQTNTPTKSISQTTEIPTRSITQSEHNPTPTKSIQTKTPTQSFIQTTQIPSPTQSKQTKTPTQSITKSATQSELIITPSKSVIIFTPTQSDNMQTETEQVVTPTESITDTNNQENDSGSENKRYNIIIILLIAVIAFQGIIILLFLIVCISSIKKNKNNNLTNLNTSLIEMV